MSLETAILVLSHDDASSARSLAGTRWELVRQLREYQLFKHSEIFDPVIRTERGSRVVIAKLLKERCLKAGLLYSAHVQKWSRLGPSSNWQHYRQEALAMADRIGAHLRAEARDIRALLALAEH